MNMQSWLQGLPVAKGGKPLPLLSFPSVSLLGVSVYDLTHSADLQVSGMVEVAKRTDAAASVSMMDLSVEAEAFGCRIVTSENEVPTVTGALISDLEEAEALAVPQVGSGRTSIYLEAAAGAKARISDRPVLAGIIGPFSLAGRLMDVSEALTNCIAEPEFVHATLEKTTQFLIRYAQAYREAGVDGVVVAEPLAGLLSPALEEEFSAPYLRRMTQELLGEEFAVLYHDCGPNVHLMTQSISGIGASAYHFGDASDMAVMLEKMPRDCLVCGNISPSQFFLNGTPESIYRATRELLDRTAGYENFVLSSGCDIPPASPWENIDAFFRAARGE